MWLLAELRKQRLKPPLLARRKLLQKQRREIPRFGVEPDAQRRPLARVLFEKLWWFCEFDCVFRLFTIACIAWSPFAPAKEDFAADTRDCYDTLQPLASRMACGVFGVPVIYCIFNADDSPPWSTA